jgi:hypothetical protein
MNNNSSNESPIYKVFKNNEAAFIQAIKFASAKSAKRMGKEFTKVYNKFPFLTH